MASKLDLLSFDNAVFSHYAFYTGLVLIKVLAMGVLTSFRRMQKKAFVNPEDAIGFAGSKVKVIADDPDVERARRNHLNDIENVPVFALLGLLYVATQPATSTALLLFRIFAASRYLHTIAYQFAIPQPTRALCHITGLVVNVIMAVRVLSLAAF